MSYGIPSSPSAVGSDQNAAYQALQRIVPSGQVTELRALEAKMAGQFRPGTITGFFNDLSSLVAWLPQILEAKSIYYIPNPVNPALIARANNRLRIANQGDTTSDRDIIQRNWLLIDSDPIRPTGISSTEQEHAAAIELTRHIAGQLQNAGWPDPIWLDSGNGAHLMYRVDLPVNDGGLIQRCLQALAAIYDNSQVHVDIGVYNPARIWKLPGTWAAKGDHTTDRPHRLARVLSTPSQLYLVPMEKLNQLAGYAPAVTPVNYNQRLGQQQRGLVFDLTTWITEHKLDVIGPTPWNQAQRWVFRTCPWNSDHTNRSAFIAQFPNGAITAGCHHNGCDGKSWHDLRLLF
jgi:hypothetical protein